MSDWREIAKAVDPSVPFVPFVCKNRKREFPLYEEETQKEEGSVPFVSFVCKNKKRHFKQLLDYSHKGEEGTGLNIQNPHTKGTEGTKASSSCVTESGLNIQNPHTKGTEGTKVVCFNCKGSDLWTTTQGDIRCRQCHPPVPGAELLPGETPDAMPTPGTPGTCSACRAFDAGKCYSFVYRTGKAGKPTPTTPDRPACEHYKERKGR